MHNILKHYVSVADYIRKHTALLLISAAIFVITLYNLTPSFNTYDTSFYVLAGEKLLNGDGLNCLRTPVYPLFLQLCGWIGGDGGMNTVATFLQSLLFIFSVYVLYDTCRRVLKSNTLSFLITLYYILIPAAGWANEMLTESLGVSLFVILTHWIVCFIQRPSTRLNIAISLLLTVMVLMRPNFISFFVILPFLWGHQWFKTKEKVYVWALLMTTIPMGSYVGYCYAYQQQYGEFTSSFATKCNVYFLWDNNLWNTDLLENQHEKRSLQTH